MNEDWQVVLENTHEAVLAYARSEVEGLARRVIHRLQRIGATGIYGDDFAYKSLWDEWCHEVQEGPYDLLDSAWELTLNPILEDVINRVPRHVAVLLSVYAIWELRDDDDPMMTGSFWIDGICQVLRVQLNEVAGQRRLDHLGPWRNG